MVHLRDGGGGGAAAQQIEITIEEIKRIAATVMADLAERAEKDSTELSRGAVEAAAFGQSPPGRAVGTTAQAAHEVFTATVTGVFEVLTQYQENLNAVVRTYEATDDATAQGLARLTPEELLQRFQDRNDATIAYNEAGHHEAVESAEQQAYQENQDVLGQDVGPTAADPGAAAPTDHAPTDDGATDHGATDQPDARNTFDRPGGSDR